MIPVPSRSMARVTPGSQTYKAFPNYRVRALPSLPLSDTSLPPSDTPGECSLSPIPLRSTALETLGSQTTPTAPCRNSSVLPRPSSHPSALACPHPPPPTAPATSAPAPNHCPLPGGRLSHHHSSDRFLLDEKKAVLVRLHVRLGERAGSYLRRQKLTSPRNGFSVGSEPPAKSAFRKVRSF